MTDSSPASLPTAWMAPWEPAEGQSGVLAARLTLRDLAPFRGHFPGAPVFPGALLLEALHQLARRALAAQGREGALRELTSARFRTPLRPGDRVEAELGLVPEGPVTRVRAQVACGGRAVASFGLLLGPGPQEGPEVAPEASPSVRALDQRFIRSVLPHRHPMLLVDRADLLGGDPPRLRAQKAVSAAEPPFANLDGPEAESFRYPPALLLESFCQACGLLLSVLPGEPMLAGENVPFLARLGPFRMLGEVHPGEVVEHHVRLVGRAPGGAIFAGESHAGARLLCTAERIVAASGRLS